MPNSPSKMDLFSQFLPSSISFPKILFNKNKSSLNIAGSPPLDNSHRIKGCCKDEWDNSIIITWGHAFYSQVTLLGAQKVRHTQNVSISWPTCIMKLVNINYCKIKCKKSYLLFSYEYSQFIVQWLTTWDPSHGYALEIQGLYFFQIEYHCHCGDDLLHS